MIYHPFPSPFTAQADGVVAYGGDLQDSDLILSAYLQGIFPWPMQGVKAPLWFSPDPRGVLFIQDFHLPHSFKKFLKKHPYTVTWNQAFEEVVSLCQETHEKRNGGTWITNDFKKGLLKLFQQKWVYSVEVWEKQELVGGLYGFRIGSYVSGESMFHLKDNCSKLALFELVSTLQKESIEWIDTQMVTPLLKDFGAKEISRVEFMERHNANIRL